MAAEVRVLTGVVRHSPGERLHRWWRLVVRHRYGYAMLAPFLIGFFLFTILPVLASLALSLTTYDVLQRPHWVGLQNYQALFLYDDVFIIAVKNTFIYGIITGPVGLGLSFFFAWFINRVRVTWRVPLTLALYAPSMQAGATVAFIATYFLSTNQYGLFNYWLYRLGFIHKPIAWLANPHLIMPVMIVLTLWMSMGTGFLIFLAGLQTVPKELYEAARVDGVRNAWQELIHVTIPQMKPFLLISSILAVVASFGGSGLLGVAGGVNSTDYAALTIQEYAADYAGVRFMMGYAAAISVVMFVWSYGLGRVMLNTFRTK